MGMKILDNHQRLKLQNTNKNMPRYSKLLDMRDMQMNPAVWYPFIPNSLAAIRKLATASVARETEIQGHPCPAGGRVAGAATLERNLALFSQTKYRKTLWPDVPPPAPPSTCLGRCWHGSTCDKGHVRGFSLSVCVGEASPLTALGLRCCAQAFSGCGAWKAALWPWCAGGSPVSERILWVTGSGARVHQ